MAGETQHIQEMFTVDRNMLKHITSEFASELEKGLHNEDSDIPMNVTWAMGYPTGHEKGRYITVDMGGTNLRVCNVLLTEARSAYEITQSTFKLPDGLKTGTADELWDFIADSIQQFFEQYGEVERATEKMPLAFTFSYPVTQHSIRHGILQRWTKGFDISGIEGHDVVAQLEHALERRNLPVKVIALVNDTTGTLIASAYKDPQIQIGSIFSTGCNAAYREECGSIPKIAGHGLSPSTNVAINTEYGAFDNRHQVLPRTVFDQEIDNASPRPGQQTYEKMMAGLYVGELTRLILVHLHECSGLFAGSDTGRLRCTDSIKTSFLARLEETCPKSLGEMQILFSKELGITPTLHEAELCCLITDVVCTRAARLYACGIAAICRKKCMQSCHVGVDGSAFTKYPRFRERAATALREIFDWPDDSDDLVTLCPAEDGSGVGAALIAALAGASV